MTPEQRASFLDSLRFGLPIPRALSGAYGGRIPVKAWRVLGEMRRVGGEGWDAEVADACEAAERREKEAKEHDRSEQGAAQVPAVGSAGASREPAAGVQGGGDGVVVRDDAGGLRGHLGPGGRGRAEGQEAEEGPGTVPGGPLPEVAGLAAGVGLTPAPPPLRSFWAAANDGGRVEEEPSPESGPITLTAPIPSDTPLSRFAAEARDTYGPGLFGLLRLQDDRLADKRVHRMGPWWLEMFEAFFASRLSLPTLQWILALVGRGGGKSSTLERLAIVVALFAPRTMSPNERWQWPFISVLQEDARRRIFEIEKLIKLAYGLDVKALRAEMKIETEDVSGNAIEFLSMASTIGAVSGPSSMGATVDEAAKMRTTGVNPDVELIVSLAETSRARDNWIGVRCSSAWETRGAHHAAVMRGSNAVNFVATIGPKWIDVALDGYAEVAAWEAAQGNAKGAAQIRAWARTLHAWSPNVPTWVCNPTIGALASRILLETVPRSAEDDDIDATTYWLRECGSMPLAREGGTDFAEQCATVGAWADKMRRGGGKKVPMVMPVRGVPPGDPRYAGPQGGGVKNATDWRKRGMF